MTEEESLIDLDCISGSTLISSDTLLNALGEIGLNSDSSALRHELVERLQQATTSSKVTFSDFVKCVKDVYQPEFIDRDELGARRSSECGDACSLAITEDNRRLTNENEILKKENEMLKRQLMSAEKSCLKSEDDITRLRKELQLQIENVRNLARCSLEAESKVHQSLYIPKPRFNEDVVDNSSRSKVTRNDSRAIDKKLTTDHRDVALEMLHFIEELHLMLSKLEPPGRNTSVCRISSCTAAPVKCVAYPRTVAVVTRAATVSTTTRAADSTTAGRGPPRYVRGQRKSHLDRSVMLKKIIEDAEKMVAIVKPILEGGDCSGRVSLSNRPFLNSVDSSQSERVAKAIGKLHRNIPSTAVVTIMSRV